jgi:hypothetical protein
VVKCRRHGEVFQSRWLLAVPVRALLPASEGGDATSFCQAIVVTEDGCELPAFCASRFCQESRIVGQTLQPVGGPSRSCSSYIYPATTAFRLFTILFYRRLGAGSRLDNRGGLTPLACDCLACDLRRGDISGIICSSPRRLVTDCDIQHHPLWCCQRTPPNLRWGLFFLRSKNTRCCATTACGSTRCCVPPLLS